MLNKIKTTMILAAGLFMFANEADAQTWEKGNFRNDRSYENTHYNTLLEHNPTHKYSCYCDYDPPKYYTKHPVDSYPDLFYNFGPSSNPDAIIERYDYILRKDDCYPID